MKKLLTLLLAITVSASADPYHAEIAPLLRVYCAGCHNEDDFEADFSVELFQSLMEGDSRGEVIEPGDGLGSRMIRLMDGRHGKADAMPPADESQPSKEEIARLVAWIDAGAAGPKEDVSILSTLTVPEITSRAKTEPITAAAVHGDLIARAHYRSVSISNGVELADLAGKINALHFSEDGSQLVTASGITGLNGVATIWDVATGEKIAEFSEGHSDVLYDAVLSPNEKFLATAGYDRRVMIRDITTGKIVHQNRIHNGAIFDLAFSPDGSVLASASADESIKLWSVETGERIATLPQPEGEQYSVAFTPDGKFILAGGADNRIRKWRFLTKDSNKINPLLHARFAHEGAIVDLVVTPDGKQLISSAEDLSIRQWELPSLRLVRSIENQPDVAASLTLDSEGVVVWRLDGTSDVIPLDFSVGALSVGKKAAKTKLSDPTSPEDRAKLTESTKKLPGAADITGKIEVPGDSDTFQFSAKAGEQWVAEVAAARSKSPLDSRLEILTAEGEPILARRLQALRDSWFTFRGKNSKQVNDFRLQNWEEMELNEYLYAGGEVTRLWLYPRGPDSGFTVYPGTGDRRTYFNTSPVTHALGEPAYIVRPLMPGAEAAPNGLPVFEVYYDNDDSGDRRYGADSRVLFTAPADGDYLVRISDVRGQGGNAYDYTLTVRERDPDFQVKLENRKVMVGPGSGKEVRFTLTRMDEFDGPVRIDIAGLPAGFHVATPITVESGQVEASAVLWADVEAPTPDREVLSMVKITATAKLRGGEVARPITDGFEELGLGADPKLSLEILTFEAKPIENGLLEIEPGQTIRALVRADRVDFKERIELGKENSGRNLPHGLYIDNIGLNGLLIVEEETDRDFFITAAKWVKPGIERIFFVRTKANGGQASKPIIIRVVESKQVSLR